MQVLLETTKNGVRATALLPWKVVTEGETEAVALARLRTEFDRTMPQGTRLVEFLQSGSTTNPWMAFAGDMKNDPLYDAWQESILEYRQQQNQDENLEPTERKVA